MASTLDLLKRLAEHQVECVIIGGMAGVLHGSPIVTEDVDVCAPLDRENLARILNALSGLHPRFRMNPQRPPLPDDPERLRGCKNLYLLTDLGQLDILSETSGIGDYGEVARHAMVIEVGGTPYRVLDLESLIQAKRAMGRAKDLRAAAELEAIRARIREKKGSNKST